MIYSINIPLSKNIDMVYLVLIFYNRSNYIRFSGFNLNIFFQVEDLPFKLKKSDQMKSSSCYNFYKKLLQLITFNLKNSFNLKTLFNLKLETTLST